VSLIVDVAVNSFPIGQLTISRQEEFTAPGRVYTYVAEWFRDGVYHRALIHHRYSDGPLVLIRKATQALTRKKT
jgi:hypothetical protein